MKWMVSPTRLLAYSSALLMLSEPAFSEPAFISPPVWDLAEDSDQDGLRDVDELLMFGMDPLDPSDGLSDEDVDLLSMAWEIYYETDPELADTDGDTWSDGAELMLHGTDPLNPKSFPQGTSGNGQKITENSNPTATFAPQTAAALVQAPPPSLTNGDFNDLAVTDFRYHSGKDYQGKVFDWGTGTENDKGWTAYVGSKIEVWKSGDERFIELDGWSGHYGVKQPIANVAAGSHVLYWQQSGRTSSHAGDNAYRVQVYYVKEGKTEVKIADTGNIANLDNTKWTPNALGFTITEEQIADADGSPIYVAFIPSNNDTYGTLIDKVGLVPIESAPEVLAVNSDFDEGRIDPDTGYAIPDCDDVPGVDRKTGAGNSELRLDTDRAHLDGLFADDERVTDDMHKGWFGVHPSQLGKDFWDGASVTIRKLDKIDGDTGRKESGQVRFYAKWGDQKFGGYYGITPYELQTLTANNLVTSGVNGKQGEGVYGSSSTIPADGEFWMEGVRPGKITLEWRLQKGDIDVKYEQTFLVCTQQSKGKWFEQLSYMIRLQTQDDPSGEISIMSLPALPEPKESYGGEVDVRDSPTKAAGYGSNVERASEYYDFYEQSWNQNKALSWSGLAKVVGAQVISGISDTQWGLLSQPGFIDFGGWVLDYPKADLEDFQIELLRGGEAIFKDIAWQHHAYLASGIYALEFVHENQNDVIPHDVTDDVLAGWKLIDQGSETGDTVKILNGGFQIARYEQNTVITETYANLDGIGGGALVDLMSSLANNPVQGGDSFWAVAGEGAKLSNTAKRWTWVTAGILGHENPDKNGILKAWVSLTHAQKHQCVNEDLRDGARRFSVPWILTSQTSSYLPDADIQVWDHLDQPGKQ